MRRFNDLKQEVVPNNEWLENKILELQLASEKQAEKLSKLLKKHDKKLDNLKIKCQYEFEKENVHVPKVVLI